MSEIAFGELTEHLPRAAWSHEALVFTPWLSRNLQHLSRVLGIPLEITGMEAPVGQFRADILARNPQDDSVVLIENQIEPTNHEHLGQIMTYLAGLEASTVVWIASDFREPHLSAVRWLNTHTSETFSFFAVKVRVLRIGDSPFAPVFDVLEKPNAWERRLTEIVRPARTGGDTELGRRRREFWTAYLARRPEAASANIRALAGSWQQVVAVPNLCNLTLWLGRLESGIFIPKGRGERGEDRMRLLEPYAFKLEEALGAQFSHGSLPSKIAIGHADEPRWDELIDFLEEKRTRYTRVLRDVFMNGAASEVGE